jgi:hypothetical protein
MVAHIRDLMARDLWSAEMCTELAQRWKITEPYVVRIASESSRHLSMAAENLNAAEVARDLLAQARADADLVEDPAKRGALRRALAADYARIAAQQPKTVTVSVSEPVAETGTGGTGGTEGSETEAAW